METARNVPRVLAQLLRGGLSQIEQAGVPRADTEGARDVFENGKRIVADIADELEAMVSAPDPARRPSLNGGATQ